MSVSNDRFGRDAHPITMRRLEIPVFRGGRKRAQMGMRVEGRVCVRLCFLCVVAAIATTARPASGAEKGEQGLANAEVDEGRSKSDDGFRVGALGGVGFPRPLTIEGVIGIERALAVG